MRRHRRRTAPKPVIARVNQDRRSVRTTTSDGGPGARPGGFAGAKGQGSFVPGAVVMMTVVAGVLIYFGWWTKAAVAASVGLAMIVLANTVPDHGTFVLFGGLAVFAFLALLVLYAYYKGQLDKNQNGIPDFLEKNRAAAP